MRFTIDEPVLSMPFYPLFYQDVYATPVCRCPSAGISLGVRALLSLLASLRYVGSIICTKLMFIDSVLYAVQ